MYSILTAEELTVLGVKANFPDALIEAAEQLIEEYLHRKLKLQEYTEIHAEGHRIMLKAYPVKEILSVKVKGEPVPYALEEAESGILYVKAPGRAEITYIGGMEIIPMPVKYAAAMICQSILKAAENGGQVMMSERLSDYQVMYYNTSGGNGTIAPAAAALLNPYKGRWI